MTPTRPKEFYVQFGTRGFVPIKAKPVTLEGLEGLDLFLHRYVSEIDNEGNPVYSKFWEISEGRSGMACLPMNSITTTQAEAKEAAQERLTRFKAETEGAILRSLATTGLSPRYQKEEEAAA